MKTKQIRKISEVPSWFNYSNYKAFSSLTLEQYIEQIIIRVGLIHTITEDDEIFEPLFDSPLWLKIKSESPILKFELDNSFQTREQIIFNYNAIESVDYDMAHTCCMSAESIVEESHESNNIPPSIETAFKEVIGDRNQWLSINLHEATDDEILNELRSKLPAYRAELNAPETLINNIEKQLGNLYDYRCHMLLDLLLWQLEESAKTSQRVIITKPVLLQVLFPSSHEDFNSVNQLENKTIKTTNDLLNSRQSLLRKIQLTLQGSPHLGRLNIETHSKCS